MAIDTENKRRSVQAYTLGLARPIADGTIDEGDRATSTWFYSGIDYDNPAPSTSILSWFLDFRTFARNVFKGGFN